MYLLLNKSLIISRRDIFSTAASVFFSLIARILTRDNKVNGTASNRDIFIHPSLVAPMVFTSCGIRMLAAIVNTNEIKPVNASTETLCCESSNALDKYTGSLHPSSVINTELIME